MTTPFVIDLGFTPQRLRRHRQGRRPRRDADRRLCRRLRRARLSAGDHACGSARSCRWPSNLVFTWQALVGTDHWALTAAIIAENFTGAIGTVIFVAYLSALCQNPLHTATQYALLTALVGGRPHLSVGGRGLCRRRRPAGLVLHRLRAGRAAEPRAALVAAGARAFRRGSRRRGTIAASATPARCSPVGHRAFRIALQALLRKHLPAVAAVPFERLAVATGPCSRH